MEQHQNSPEQSKEQTDNGTPSQHDTNKAPARRTDAEKEEADKGAKKTHKTSVTAINSIISSPTENVRSRQTGDSLANTGTNVSYEGPTSAAAGGTGYNSGQPATGARISTSDDYDTGRAGNTQKEEDEEKDEKDII